MSTSGLDAEKIESNQEERTANVHRLDSLNLLLFTTLLVIVVLTIWIFKRRNFRYIHETCLALIYGRIGLVIAQCPSHDVFFGQALSLAFSFATRVRPMRSRTYWNSTILTCWEIPFPIGFLSSENWTCDTAIHDDFLRSEIRINQPSISTRFKALIRRIPYKSTNTK